MGRLTGAGGPNATLGVDKAGNPVRAVFQYKDPCTRLLNCFHDVTTIFPRAGTEEEPRGKWQCLSCPMVQSHPSPFP